MGRNITSLARAALALAFLVVLAGCATPPNSGAMRSGAVIAPHAVVTGGVGVETSGGLDERATTGTGIANADLKAAIEASLVDNHLFDRVGTPGRYQLRAALIQVTKPSFGASFTVDVEIGWTLVDTQSGKVLLRKPLTASYTATMSEAVVGATRIRLAIEGAVRENIKQAMRALAQVDYAA